MNPREIDVHIEGLVLHGFDPRSRWSVADALENELRGLLENQGLPTAWLTGPAEIDAGAIASPGSTNPTSVGARIASAIYQGDRA